MIYEVGTIIGYSQRSSRYLGARFRVTKIHATGYVDLVVAVEEAGSPFPLGRHYDQVRLNDEMWMVYAADDDPNGRE